MRVALIAGTRPNFVKAAPLLRALGGVPGCETRFVHTGQHYDDALSRAVCADLELPRPDVELHTGSGSHARQTATLMTALEPVLVEMAPDWVVVVGDVNSTLAAALTAVKLGIRLAHVEAGLRSGDRSMPEEINRVATDAIADLLLTPSRDADAHLRQEGKPEDRIVFVGNVMVDSLLACRPRLRPAALRERLDLPGEFILVTLHRPATVDSPERLAATADALGRLSESRTVVFPVHPRTRPLLERLRPEGRRPPELRLLEPLGYLDFLTLESEASVVITDSGGVQEETTILGVPCLTLRPTTERPVTVLEGTNRVIGADPSCLPREVARALDGPRPGERRPEGWDGKAAPRVAAALAARA